MKRWFFATVLAVFGSSPVFADYNAGFAAYVRGDYAVALREWVPEAEAGNISAQRNLAVMFRDGRGVEQDLDQALAWFTRAALAGSASSQYELGKLYEKSDFPGRNRALALRWFEAAAEQGHANALQTLVELHGDADPQESLRWLEKAATGGIASAQIELGDRYRDGRGVSQDEELARRWYQAAATQGQEDAVARLRSLGTSIALTSRGAVEVVEARPASRSEVARREASGTAEDDVAPTARPRLAVPEQSQPAPVVVLSVAAVSDSPTYIPVPRSKPALEPLSEELPRFVGPVPKPLPRLVEVAEVTAVVETVPATPALEDGAGASGNAVGKTSSAAAAVEAPNPGQQVGLEAASDDAAGETAVPKTADARVAFIEALDAYAAGDYAGAVEIWEVLAEGGLPEAQSNLGAMYDKGLFVPQDYDRALELFQAAAEQGLASAQFNLGVMFAEGRGTEKDIEAAADWHRRAAAQGHPLATEYLAVIVRADRARPQEREVASVPVAEPAAVVAGPEPVVASAVPVTVAAPAEGQQPERLETISTSEDVALALPAVAPDAGGVSAVSSTVSEDESSPSAQMAYASGLAAFAAGDYGGAIGIWEPLAEGRHLNSMFGLGLVLDQGLGAVPDADRAYQLLTAAADRGHPDARHYLTTSRKLGSGDGDLSRDAELVRQTTRGALVEGQNALAAFSDFALAGAEPYPTWKFWLRRVVGYAWRPWAKFDEARDAYRDRLYVQAFNAWREVALDGHAAAQNNIGVMYANGQGTGRDLIAATSWFRRAARQDEPVAVLNQGLAGLVRNDSDPQAIVDVFRRAANLGVPAATYNLGVAYADGLGVLQSMNEAALAFRVAADQGDALANYNLAVMYERGISFSQNMAEALSLYRSAASGGEVRAQVALGLRYAKGDGVVQNNRAAADLFRLAAEAGDPIAQHNLGVLYAFGYTGDLIYAFNDGVSEDLAQAQYWLTRAAAGGIAEAEERLDVLSLRLGDQDVVRAERLIEQSRLETLLN